MVQLQSRYLSAISKGWVNATGTSLRLRVQRVDGTLCSPVNETHRHEILPSSMLRAPSLTMIDCMIGTARGESVPYLVHRRGLFANESG